MLGYNLLIGCGLVICIQAAGGLRLLTLASMVRNGRYFCVLLFIFFHPRRHFDLLGHDQAHPDTIAGW
jgi:hypothetical protein